MLVVFGLGSFAFGVAGFLRIDRAESRNQDKLHSIQAGEIRPETLTVLRKYVNPGRSGLPHVVFSGSDLIDLSATRDFFNSVNLGTTVRAYNFPDGYFIPENLREESPAGKWFLLCLGTLLGGTAISLAWMASSVRRKR